MSHEHVPEPNMYLHPTDYSQRLSVLNLYSHAVH